MKKEDGIGARVKELMLHLNKNQSTFGESIGVSQTTVRNIIYSISLPRHELIDKILKAYPSLSADWLVRGEGEMFKTNTKSTTSDSADYLMETLSKIEKSFMKDIDEKNRMIDDQRFIIETLKKQIEILMQGQGLNFQDPKIEEPFVYPTAA